MLVLVCPAPRCNLLVPCAPLQPASSAERGGCSRLRIRASGAGMPFLAAWSAVGTMCAWNVDMGTTWIMALAGIARMPSSGAHLALMQLNAIRV